MARTDFSFDAFKEAAESTRKIRSLRNSADRLRMRIIKEAPPTTVVMDCEKALGSATTALNDEFNGRIVDLVSKAKSAFDAGSDPDDLSEKQRTQTIVSELRRSL